MIKDQLRPLGSSDTKVTKIVRGTESAPMTETVTITKNRGCEAHRRISSAGENFGVDDPRGVFADIDEYLTNVLRGLVADDRVQMFKMLLKKYVPGLKFSNHKDRDTG